MCGVHYRPPSLILSIHKSPWRGGVSLHVHAFDFNSLCKSLCPGHDASSAVMLHINCVMLFLIV
jgi:hypothetical protein